MTDVSTVYSISLMGKNCDRGYNSLSCSCTPGYTGRNYIVCHMLVQFAMYNELYKRDCKIDKEVSNCQT